MTKKKKKKEKKTKKLSCHYRYKQAEITEDIPTGEKKNQLIYSIRNSSTRFC